MRRLEKQVVVLLLGLLTALGAAQADLGQPADPMAAPEMAQPEIPDVSWVRVAHFSPNAPEIEVSITPTSEDVTYTGDGFGPVSYQGVTEYIEVPAGNYAVSAQGVDATLEEEFSFARGNYYTLSAIGLVLPPEVQAEAEEDADEGNGGIAGFFRNLFGEGQGDRDRLALQLSLFEDDLARMLNEGETVVRVVHAAPGAEPVDLAVSGEQGTLVDNVQFGDASRYASFEGSIENLELRLTGSRAVTMTVADTNLQQGNINTVYVVGTPVEEAPLTLLGSSIAPVEVGSPAGEDVAVQAMQQGETAGGGAGEEAGDAQDGEEAEDGESEEPAADDSADGAAADDAAGDSAGDGAADDAAGQDAAGEEAEDEEAEEGETEQQ